MKKFGLNDKLGYMFGDFGNDFFFTFISSFLMLFYTDVLGIGGAIVGGIFLVARIWDAFMDMSWGRFIDSRTSGKAGKFKPWIMRMSFPLVVFGVLTFNRFPGMSDRFNLIYAFATYIIWGSLYSTVNIPYGSMASVITSDPTERASLSTFRCVGASIAGIIISVIVPLTVFVNGRANADRFRLVAIGFAIAAMICYSLCYFLTTERIASNNTAKEKLSWKVTLIGIKRNKPLLALITSALILLISNMLCQSMNAYVFKDYFHNTKILTVAGLITTATSILLAPFIAPAVKRFGKKEFACFSIGIAVIAYFLLYILPIKDVNVFLVIMFIGQLGIGVFNITIWAFVTDVIDYQEYLTDTREEGTIYAIYSFARKIGQAISGGFGGVALGMLGYVGGAASQTEQVANNIKDFSTLTPAIAYLIMLLVLFFLYPLNKKRLEEVFEELEQRRAINAENIEKFEFINK